MMQQEVAPPVNDREPYRREVIGEYVQPIAEEMLDKNRQAIVVPPGNYAVVAAMTLDGKRVLEGGIIFDGADRDTGEAKTLVQFHSTRELRDLSKSGKLQLETGRSQSMFDDRTLKQSADKSRMAVRR
jgi:hypothetical protein